MNIVMICADPKPADDSACLTVAERFLARMRELYPTAAVTRHDLYSETLPEMDLSGYAEQAVLLPGDEAPDEAMKAKIGAIETLAREVKDCDRLILAAPLWNLGLPARLKNYLDLVVLQGQTVSIDDAGVHPALEDRERKALFIQSSGGRFGHAPLSLLNFAWHELRSVLSAMGMASVRLLPVDGTGSTSLSKEKAVARSLLRLDEAIQNF